MRLGTKECDFYVVNGLSIEKRISKIQKKKTMVAVSVIIAVMTVHEDFGL